MSNWLHGLTPKTLAVQTKAAREVAQSHRGNARAVMEALAERPFGATKGQLSCVTGLTEKQIEDVFRRKLGNGIESHTIYMVTAQKCDVDAP